MLNPETLQMLQEYARGNVSNRELGEWLAGAEYDSALQAEERDRLAELRLIVVEEAEGRRKKEAVLSAVAAMLAPDTPDRTLRIVRTSASTTWPGTQRLTGAASPVRRAGI